MKGVLACVGVGRCLGTDMCPCACVCTHVCEGFDHFCATVCPHECVWVQCVCALVFEVCVAICVCVFDVSMCVEVWGDKHVSARGNSNVSVHVCVPACV